MDQAIKKYINQLSEKYTLDKRNDDSECERFNTEEISNIVEKMVLEFSQNGISRNCNISPDIKRNINKLYIIYEILDECGYQAASRIEENDYIEPYKREVIIRLKMLYLRALNEIIYLLQGGYSSAAFGRARAIYEISVFFEIISKNDENVSKAFLDHSNSSRYEYAKELNDPEFQEGVKRSLLEINPDNHFWKSFQWAAPLIINNKKITFRDLAHITELSKYYHFYKASCQCAHATIIDCVKGIGISEAEKGKPIWITECSENGIDFVIKMTLIFSEEMIQKYFGIDSIYSCIIGMLILSMIGETS